LFRGDHVNLRLADWIWHVRGSLALAPDQSIDDAFDRLDPLFQQTGTSHERTDDALIFRKKGQAAQDKMSVFDSGVLRIERGDSGRVLRYHLISRALLFCFLMPFMFLAVAQLTIFVGKFGKPVAEATNAAGKKREHKKPSEKQAAVPLNPIDKALGAPEPDKPGKDKPGGRDKKPTPTPAYVFAAIFTALYVVGRILEDRLVKRLFRRSLLGT
jgi:hypothetical protein